MNQSNGIVHKVTSYLNNLTDTISHSKQLSEVGMQLFDHKDQVIADQINKNKVEIKKLQEEQGSVKSELGYLNEQRDIFKTLLKSKNVSKVQAIEYELRYIQAQRELKRISSDIEYKTNENNELNNKRIVQRTDELRIKYERLIELNKEKFDVVSQVNQLEEALSKLEIHAPINGIIQGINIVNGVTAYPGEELLSIIPEDSDVIFEAKASLAQKAKISLSQDVEVQFDGFNTLQFDRVSGKIINISPYTFDKVQANEQYTKIVVALDHNAIKSKDSEYPVKLGISGTLYISAEKQSLIAYVLGPLYNSFSNLYGQK